MRSFACLLFAGAALLLAPTVHAQNFSIDWYTIAGGGGASANGNFAVTGTIGQPATSTMSGGNFTVTSGFWSLLSVVQSANAPTLFITNNMNGTATLYWAAPAPGFVIEQSQNGQTGAWANTGGTTVTNAGVISLTINVPAGSKMFRLWTP